MISQRHRPKSTPASWLDEMSAPECFVLVPSTTSLRLIPVTDGLSRWPPGCLSCRYACSCVYSFKVAAQNTGQIRFEYCSAMATARAAPSSGSVAEPNSLSSTSEFGGRGDARAHGDGPVECRRDEEAFQFTEDRHQRRERVS
jgi:hypothetical protein